MSIESVMPSKDLVLCHPLLLLSLIFPSLRVFSNELPLFIRGPSIGPSASASVLLRNIQGWFPLGLTGLISLQSILKEINPEYSLEGLMLKLLFSGHLMRRVDYWKRPWFWEWLKVQGEGDDRIWDGWMSSLTEWTWVWVNSGSWWWTGRPGVLQFMGSQRVRHDWATELNWTELK